MKISLIILSVLVALALLASLALAWLIDKGSR